MRMHYVLVGQTPVPLDDIEPPDRVALRWAEWFGTADRQVALTRLPWAEVSTVFLGLNHAFGNGEPLLFESMVFWFGDRMKGYEQTRCATWSQAEEMHRDMVAEASRPGAFAAFALRSIRKALWDARYDLSLAWREMRGTVTEIDEALQLFDTLYREPE